MSKSIGTPQQLQDIPLSTIDEPIEPQAPHGDTTTVMQKTNSLKRFFKMPLKRNNAGEAATGQPKGDLDETKSLDAATTSQVEQATQPSPSRFHLRLGGMSKYGSQMNAELNDEPKASINKINLKKSISNYWNSVFKRNPMVPRSKGGKEADDISAALNEAADKLAHIDEDAMGEHNNDGTNDNNANLAVDIEKDAIVGDEEDNCEAEKLAKQTNEITNQLHTLSLSDDGTNQVSSS